MSGQLSVDTSSLTGAWQASISGTINSSDAGAGVYGVGNGPNAHGVQGSATGDNGVGVFGEVTGANSVAISGRAVGSNGVGGYFTSRSGYGLIVDDGNVGIGTTSPSEKLDVTGNVRVSGDLTVDGGIRGPNPIQVALLRWYEANTSGITYPVGTQPRGICFDGANIWVVNWGSNNVTKLNASDGSKVGDYAAGNSPWGICFDGAHIWVANYWSQNVTKLWANNGRFVANYNVGIKPIGICFDGANIWVTNDGSNTVTKLKASDGSFVGTYTVGTHPSGICFDGANIWVANGSSNNVTKL